jgi:hypothetical protein
MNNKDDKPDTLPVKSRAKKEIVYYYKREERLSMLKHKPGDTSGKGIVRNKILLIIVCDIILIILIFSLINHFVLNKDENSQSVETDMGNYSLHLRGYRIKDKVFARLFIEKKGKTGRERKMVSVLFSLHTGQTMQVNETLPHRAGDEIKIEATLISRDQDDILSAEIRIGDQSDILSLLPRER